MPNISDDYAGNYVDFDVYGTANFVEQFGLQVGYRSMSAFYEVQQDTGDLAFRGGYVGAVLRF